MLRDAISVKLSAAYATAAATNLRIAAITTKTHIWKDIKNSSDFHKQTSVMANFPLQSKYVYT